MSVELLLALNSSCGACASLGPPPSAILTLPPPPMPAFLRAVSETPDGEGAASTAASPCEQACDWNGAPGVEYVELPRQVGGVGAVDDTWFLVLVSCCAGVLLLGAVLAIVLMRCRQGRSAKCVLSLDPSSLDGVGGKSSKLVGGEVLYPDPRALWAALTPSGGTQHFVGPVPHLAPHLAPHLGAAVAPPPPVPHLQLTQRHLSAPSPPPQPSPPAEPEYAMPLSAGPPPLEPPPPPPVRVVAFPPPSPQPPQPRHHHSKHTHPRQHGHINKMATLSHATYAAAADTSSFDNSGFVDSDDQLLTGMVGDAPLGFYHTVAGSRRGLMRPKVSSPTRIANPNLPPLNLHPTASRRSLRRAARHAERPAERHAERHAERQERHDRHDRHGDRRSSDAHASNGHPAL